MTETGDCRLISGQLRKENWKIAKPMLNLITSILHANRKLSKKWSVRKIVKRTIAMGKLQTMLNRSAMSQC